MALSCLFVDEEMVIFTASKHKSTHGKSSITEARYRFRMDNAWIPSNIDPGEPIEMKLTTDMLTKEGFIAVNLGPEDVVELTQSKESKEFYIGVSGGGWRALTGHMGAFRGLSNTSALSKVTMISSVSGGSWFLSKLGFDEDFAVKVLLDDFPIGDVVSEWLRINYFTKIQRVLSEDVDVKGSVSEIVSQAAATIKQFLGTVILVADRFDLSWQEAVETLVLGEHIANKTLDTAKVVHATRAKLGDHFIFSYNWNQLHEWRDNGKQWFLKKRLGNDGQEHVQYPVYASAQYEQLENGQSKVEVRAQGKPIAELLTVCSQEKVDVRVDDIEDTSADAVGTTTLAKVVNAGISILDTMINVFIAASVAKVSTFACLFVLGLQPTRDTGLYAAVIVLIAMAYIGQLHVNDTTLIQSCLIMGSVSFLCWLTSAFILYRRRTFNVKCTDIMWHSFIATVRVPIQTLTAVVGAAIAGGAETAMVTGTAVLVLQVWTMYERDMGSENLKKFWEFRVMIVAMTCISAHGVSFVVGTGLKPGFLKALVLTVLAIGLVFWRLRSYFNDNVMLLLPIVLVGVLFVLQAKEVTSRAGTGAVALAAYFACLTRQKLINPHSITIINFVIIIMETGVLLSAIPSWIEHEKNVIAELASIARQCDSFDFDFDGLTIGQAASASSAAAGAGAVQTWVHSVMEFSRIKADEAMFGLHCRVAPALISQVFHQYRVMNAFMTLLGCNETEWSGTTAERWSGWLRDMAVKLKFKKSTTESRMSNRVINAGYNDNSGLGPILGHYLNSTSDSAQVLVLVMNAQGDHQMETYFNNPSGNNNGGMFCEGEQTGPKMQQAFRKIDAIHNNSFKATGGKYVKQDHESTCAIRLARTLFFKDNPPRHHRFHDNRIPAHVTYAYKQDARIVRNDEFYEMPEGANKTIDLLFLMANAPVSTVSLPGSGSAPYVGLATAMKLATEELARRFPGFFGQPTRYCTGTDEQCVSDAIIDDDDVNERTENETHNKCQHEGAQVPLTDQIKDMTSSQLKELMSEASKRLGKVEDSELTVATLTEQIKKKDMELDELMVEIFELRNNMVESDQDSADSSADTDTTMNPSNWWV